MAYVTKDAGGSEHPGCAPITPTELDSVLIAYDRVEGCRIDELDDGTLGDAALDDAGVRDAFAQLAAMRGRRVAHRRVGQSTLIVGAEGSVSLVDFAFGTLAADDSLLAGDLAQALGLPWPDRRGETREPHRYRRAR